jgi:hypothetical protein|eukprot:SAG25_NODE_28_length_20925_cov_13.342839_13_plen_73_part_00
MVSWLGYSNTSAAMHLRGAALSSRVDPAGALAALARMPEVGGAFLEAVGMKLEESAAAPPPAAEEGGDEEES